MYYFCFEIVPSAEHSQNTTLGEGVVHCWIDRSTLEEAERVATQIVHADSWDIVRAVSGVAVSDSDYEAGDSGLEHYRQAKSDGEVFVFVTSPRYPLYRVIAEVEQCATSDTERAVAHYFFAGYYFTHNDEDLYEVGFWNDERVRVVLSAARNAIAEAGWTVVTIQVTEPCGPTDVDQDLMECYDSAEEDGACLALVHEAPPGDRYRTR